MLLEIAQTKTRKEKKWDKKKDWRTFLVRNINQNAKKAKKEKSVKRRNMA